MSATIFLKKDTSSSSLIVSEYYDDCETCERIGEIAKKWEVQAALNIDVSAIFRDLLYITTSIAAEMKKEKTEHFWNSIFTCERKDDSSHEVQAIALVSDEWPAKEILFIATNPHNVRSTINQTTANRVSGAASAIIKYIATTYSTCYESVKVATMDSAVAFYKRLGFEPCVSSNNRDNCHEMALRLKK